MHPVAGTPAAPTSIAESLPRVATPVHRVCTRRSVVLSAHLPASIDAIGGPGDRGHGDVARVPSRAHRLLTVPCDAGPAGPCVLEATAGRTGPRGRSTARPKPSPGSEAAHGTAP